MTPDTTRRTFWIPDALWQQVVRAAAEEQAKRGEPYTVSEWVRNAMEKELRRQARRQGDGK